MRSPKQNMAEGPDSSSANSKLRAEEIGEEIGLHVSAAPAGANRAWGNREELCIAVIAFKFRRESDIPREVEVDGSTASVQAVVVGYVGVGRAEASVAVVHGDFDFRGSILGKRAQCKQNDD